VPVEPGLAASVELTVADADTAAAMSTGDVPVIATPRVIALAEEATVKAVDGHLADGSTSVGMRIQLDHVSPTAIGGRVVAEAKLDKVEGRRLCFSVSINDERGLVAAGKVTRVVVEREHFLDRSH
jgi:fluoroacetyl-CoA thioesterase